MEGDCSMSPKRIQRKRTKGWRMPPNTVYVGRPTKWGNPFKPKVSKDKEKMRFFLECAVSDYESCLTQGCSTSFGAIANEIEELRGKDLACWCPLDHPCHADVLLKVANLF